MKGQCRRCDQYQRKFGKRRPVELNDPDRNYLYWTIAEGRRLKSLTVREP